MNTQQAIFVFGSNTGGIHGAGAALFARQNHGAILRRGVGLQGTSYAIPTKMGIYNNTKFVTLSLGDIKRHVDVFLAFARDRQDLLFNVTNIGCGLAGYSPVDIAPMFQGAPSNCLFSEEFAFYIQKAEMTEAQND